MRLFRDPVERDTDEIKDIPVDPRVFGERAWTVIGEHEPYVGPLRIVHVALYRPVQSGHGHRGEYSVYGYGVSILVSEIDIVDVVIGVAVRIGAEPLVWLGLPLSHCRASHVRRRHTVHCSRWSRQLDRRLAFLTKSPQEVSCCANRARSLSALWNRVQKITGHYNGNLYNTHPTSFQYDLL